MSMDRLNANFQQFLKKIHNWPTSTIEKNLLIQMLEEFQHKNHELDNIYDDASTRTVLPQFSNHDDDNYSQLEPIDNHNNRSFVHNVDKHSNHQLITQEKYVSKKETNPSSPNMILIKEGDLTVRKGSTILSPLIKKMSCKTCVYCELSYTDCKNEKLIYLTIYQSRKTRKILHTFVIDDSCSFILESKREFQFKHNSAIENFTTETGGANVWSSSFNTISLRNTNNVEEIYEDPSPLVARFGSSSSSIDYTQDTPLRPPPRPPRPTNPILPENIYVCLYDHHLTTDDSFELEFTRGDLLYILNTDGPTFYIGRHLILPWNNHSQSRIGLVFKDYITSAYEKVESRERLC